MALGKRRRRIPRPVAGSAPGTLVIASDEHPSRLRATRYGPDSFEEREGGGVTWEVRPGEVLWVAVEGLGTREVLEEAARAIELPHLALEDAVSVQRPKVDAYGDARFFVLRVPWPGRPSEFVQVALFLRGDCILSIQDHPGELFPVLRERLVDPTSRFRSRGAEYLLYRQIDSLVDSYFAPLETMADRLDEIEVQVLASPAIDLLRELHAIRRRTRTLLRTSLPVRDVVATLIRTADGSLQPETVLHLRDVQDHAHQVVELAEHYNGVAGDIRELLQSTHDLRLNQAMKMLTAVATIFIPLTFITGLYGMNFDTDRPGNMPELRQPYGYPAALAVMALIGVGLYAWFRRLGWTRIERGE